MGRTMLRSLIAVLCGWAAMFGGSVVTMTVIAFFHAEDFAPGAPFSAGWWLVNLLVLFLWAVVGGFVTGVVARRYEIRHAIGLIAIAVAGYVLLAALNRNKSTAPQVPSGYIIAGYILLVPSILLGGWLRMRQAVVLQKMPAGVNRAARDLWLLIVRAVGYFRFPIAIVASAVAFLGGLYLGLLLWGLAFLEGRELPDGSRGDVVLALCLITSFSVAAVLARYVFRKIMPADTSLMKDVN